MPATVKYSLEGVPRGRKGAATSEGGTIWRTGVLDDGSTAIVPFLEHVRTGEQLSLLQVDLRTVPVPIAILPPAHPAQRYPTQPSIYKMFSKLLAFGLGALALVHAAPALAFQTPLLSCSVNMFGTESAAAVKSLGDIPAGKYRIFNEEMKGPVRSLPSPNQTISFSPESDPSSLFEQWMVEHRKGPGGADSNEYTITNVGLNTGTYAFGPDRLIFTGTQNDPANFSIQPAGDGVYHIKVPDENAVWSGAYRNTILLYEQVGIAQQHWRFVPVGDDE
ncbi:hypothetical protein K438DRAFT_1981705 [Mycena galopus ATCC 62051]|nr:hypothetical protein K438DRAFT_1981705 [Mycena galopus ATCC 62051]